MRYWYRFAHGDEVLFVHEGSGVLESHFGVIRHRPGDYLEELAVMIDTFRPLRLTTHALPLEDKSYPYSWS